MGRAADRYVAVLQRFRWLILAVTAVVAGLATWQAPQVISRATTQFDPPAGSLAAAGNAALGESFPLRGSGSSQFAIYVQSDANSSGWVESPAVAAFSRALNASLSSLTVPLCGHPCVQSLAGYWTLRDMGLPAASWSGFASADGRSTFFELAANVPFSLPEAIQFAQQTQNVLAQLAAVHLAAGDEATLLGIPAFIPTMLKDIELDLGTMDAIVIPISFCLMLLLTRSLRLLVLPAVGMLLSLCLTFGCAALLTYAVSVMSYIPSLLMSLVLAMSFDYSLFLSVRLREELLGDPLRERSWDEHVATVLATSGHTIAVSGLILCGTFLTMLALPLTFVRVTGLCAALAIVFALAVNLILLPTLLLTLRRFFAPCADPAPCCASKQQHQQPQSAEEVAADELEQSWFLRLGYFNTGRAARLLIVVACLLLVGGLAYFAATYTQSDSLGQDLPRGAPITVAYDAFVASFGAGAIYPTQLLLIAGPAAEGRVDSRVFFEAAAAAVANMSAATGGARQDWSGVVVSPSELFSADGWFAMFEQCHSPLNQHLAMCRAVLFGESQLVNASRAATLLVFRGAADPLAPGGSLWLQQTRAALAATLAAHPGVIETALLVGTPPASWDAITDVAYWFPVIMGLSCAVVVVAVGAVFRSVLIAVRSVLTLAMTVSCVFGLAALVYDQGVLDWLRFAGLRGSGGITWLIPVVCFSIVIGLSLDYDVLLITRVYEMRALGYGLQDSIRLAQHKTGKMISVAGVIMAVAFSGLIFSSSTALNQMGFILSVAVLVDTFVFRAFLVPSLMSLFGEANFWPSVQPPVTHTLREPSPWCCCRPKSKRQDYTLVN